MTREDVGKTIAIVQALWPHSTLGPDLEATVTMWATMLGDASVREVADALRKLAQDGREHAPPVGVIAHHVGMGRQSTVPGFDDIDVGRWMPSAVFLRRIYDPNGHYSSESTALAIALMAENGAHEAVLRFVEERGLRAVLMMPHGDRYPLDLNQSADRRDMARHYRDVTVPGWKADPRPGLALERACRSAGIAPADARAMIGEGERRELASGEAA